MGIGTTGHLERMSILGPMGKWDKWALRACGVWGLGQMDIWEKGHFGAKGRFGTNER